MTPDEAAKLLNELMPGIYAEVGEVMAEVFARMPFGQEFVLSNGRRGRIKKFIEPYRDPDTGQWKFAFDVVFDEGSPDHLEFFVNHTGGGGSPGSPTPPIVSSGKA